MATQRNIALFHKSLLYRYTALNASRRDIRLLEVLPGTEDTTIPLEKSQVQCRMSIESLDKSPQYNALSYVWGSEEDKQPILVDGYTFPVTRNLKEALRYLRHKSQPVKMWVDAVCINQEDGAEKSWQLAMMTNIYEQANVVQVFLGPIEDKNDKSITELIQIGEEAFDIKLSCLTFEDIARGVEPSPGDPQLAIKESFVTMSKRIGKDIPLSAWPDLINRPYWKRLWIFQEFCLGQRLMIYYGDKVIPFHVFSTLVRFIDLHMIMVLSTVTSNNGSALNADFVIEGNRTLALIASYKTPNTLAVASLIGGRHWHQSRKDGITLLQLLQRCCVVSTTMSNRAAKYPRDLIYGLLGLASDAKKLNITPKYDNVDSDEETEEIFAEVAKKLLENGNADILAWCQTHKRFSGLPSWTPDFTFIRLPVCDSTQTALFSTSGSTKLRTDHISGDSRAIGIHGIRVDTIKSPGPLWDPHNDLEFPRTENARKQASSDQKTETSLASEATSKETTIDGSIEDYLNAITEFCQQSETIYSGPTPRDTQKWKEDAYWRIPCADQTQEGNKDRVRTSATAKKGHEDLLRSFTAYAAANNIAQPDISHNMTEGQSEVEHMASIAQMVAEYQGRLGLALLDYEASLSPERGAYRRALDFLHNRRPFLSELGYVGLAPGQAKVGDLVVVFYGAIQPFVLTESKSKRGFELLGEAYVHEIMDGEFLKLQREGEQFIIN